MWQICLDVKTGPGRSAGCPFSGNVVTDFIPELPTLFPSYRLYSRGTPSAKDSCVENHGDLYNSAAQTGDKPLLSRFVDRRQAMP